MRASVVLVCVMVVSGARGGIAPFITPCRASDASCMVGSAQKAVPILAAGVPELGIGTLDPMKVDRVQANQAGLDIDFKNTIVKGLRNCKVLGLSRPDQGKRTHLEIMCSVILTGDYKLGGRLLIMPIEGEGKYKIKIRDIVVAIDFDMGTKVVGGDTYWVMKSWKHTADVKTKAEFHFQNLFNGNKQLADAVHQFANSNWREIFREIAPPVLKAIVTKIVDESSKVYERVPLKELVLD